MDTRHCDQQPKGTQLLTDHGFDHFPERAIRQQKETSSARYDWATPSIRATAQRLLSADATCGVARTRADCRW